MLCKYLVFTWKNITNPHITKMWCIYLSAYGAVIYLSAACTQVVTEVNGHRDNYGLQNYSNLNDVNNKIMHTNVIRKQTETN